MTFGQPRKLCLLGGVLPRAIEHKNLGSTFEVGFFGPVVFSRKAEISRFGAICGVLMASFDLMLALARRAK